MLYTNAVVDESQIKDSIPRIRIEQLLDSLSLIASSESACTFDRVRRALHRSSKRQAPPSREAMWTAARDVLTDLGKLGLITAGPLPRKRSEVERLKETPCRASKQGEAVARLYRESRGKAFDAILILWMNAHPYFRAFTSRLLESPMYIPDITSIKQLGQGLRFPTEPHSLAERIIESCTARLQAVDFPKEKTRVFQAKVVDRVEPLARVSALRGIDTKHIVDTIEDTIVVPAILKSEGLGFDSVTMQHIIRCSQDFYSAAVTSSHPEFAGRVLFATCDFAPDPLLHTSAAVVEVKHHGQSYVSQQFAESLISSYRTLSGSSQAYVDVYPLRALVCRDLRIQPLIFSLCLESIIERGKESGIIIYTELPFSPPPQGESYVLINGHRVGLVKLSISNGG